jgi:hypothetical protein
LGSVFCCCFRLVLLGLIRVAYDHVCQPLVPTFLVVILKLLCLARLQLTLLSAEQYNLWSIHPLIT